MADDLTGKTVRLSFKDGPTAGMTFDHTFRTDGAVAWRDAKSGKSGEAKCGVAKVADNIFVMSYLSSSGFTLTATLNFATKRVIGFASNDKQWFEQRGTLEEVKGK